MCTQISVGELEVLGFAGFFPLSITILKLWSRPIAQGQAACLKTGGKCFPHIEEAICGGGV